MKVCFLSVEPIEDQPRIRRQGDALFDAGYEVVAIGATGGRSPQPRWRIVDLELPRLSGIRRMLAMAGQASSALGRRVARRAYWSDRRRVAVLEAAAAEHADVYVAREWRTLPIAVRLAERTGAAIAFDSPELSAEESAGSRSWRLFFRPMVVAIEESDIHRARLVTAVSDGIADILRERYRLPVAPTVLRNVPPYERHEPRAVGETVEVIYLGGLLPERGLEQTIDSVARWPAGWTLTLLGPGSAAYVAELEERARPVADRVEFAGVVPLTEMVGVASRADVGIFAHQSNGPQADLALPNKLFEYMMAGLAVCVSGMPAMREVVESAGCGIVIEAPYGSDQIVDAITTLASSDLLAYKTASLAAAKDLNWESEARRYVDAFTAAFGRPE